MILVTNLRPSRRVDEWREGRNVISRLDILDLLAYTPIGRPRKRFLTHLLKLNVEGLPTPSA